MVYISNDGQIHDSVPWGMTKIVGFFSGIIYMVMLFFKTLFGLETDRYDSGSSRNHRPGFGPPRPPNRRIGRLDNTKGNDFVPLGGCSSCG